MNYERQKEYNLRYMQRRREMQKFHRLVSEGKCVKCEMILDDLHNCGSIMPGWTEIVGRNGEWDVYFQYFERETESGGKFFHRTPRTGYERFKHFYGTLAELKELNTPHS